MGHFPLLRSEDIVRDSLSGLPARASENEDAINEAITDLGGILERFLNRELAVRKVIQILPISRWENVWAFNYTQGFLTHYPLVEIVEVQDQDGNDVTNDYSVHDIEEHKERMIKGPTTFQPIRLTAFVGYRRSDQDLATLQGINTELADLSTLPSQLPSEIRSVLTEIVLNRLILASKGQLGTGQKVSGIGQQEVRISAPDHMFVNDRLRNLLDYRRVF